MSHQLYTYIYIYIYIYIYKGEKCESDSAEVKLLSLLKPEGPS